MKNSIRLDKMIICTIINLGILYPSLGMTAQIYKTTDADGNVLFSDDETKGGEAVTLNIDPSAKMSNNSTKKSIKNADKKSTKKNKEDQEAYTISITYPKDNVTFAHSSTSIMVSATINKALNEGDLIYLYVDGVQFGEGQKSQTFELKDTPRGTHTLKMAIEREVPSGNKNIKRDRNVLATSQETHFMQYRAFASNHRD